jgi:hypothetical protein
VSFKLSPKAIASLQEDKIVPTDDSHKYKAEDLEGCVVTAIWEGSQEFGAFKPTVSYPAECAIIMNKTNFYAQQGGQMFDTGFLTCTNGAIFLTKDVQVRFSSSFLLLLFFFFSSSSFLLLLFFFFSSSSSSFFFVASLARYLRASSCTLASYSPAPSA